EIVAETCARAGQCLLDGDRLDPVNRVLKVQIRPCGLGHVDRGPWVRGLGSDVEEERAIGREGAGGTLEPLGGPFEALLPRDCVVVRPVSDAEVVRWRRDDRIDAAILERIENAQRVAAVETKGRPSGGYVCVMKRRTGARHRDDCTRGARWG